MANRRRLRQSKREPDPSEKANLASRLQRSEITLPTSLIYKGRPVLWRDGELYVDGRSIGRRPQP